MMSNETFEQNQTNWISRETIGGQISADSMHTLRLNSQLRTHADVLYSDEDLRAMLHKHSHMPN